MDRRRLACKQKSRRDACDPYKIILISKKISERSFIIMAEAVIVDAVRTPRGKKKGAFRDVNSMDLAVEALNAIPKRTGIDPMVVEDVILGCVTQIREQGANIARGAVLAAGWPIEVP